MNKIILILASIYLPFQLNCMEIPAEKTAAQKAFINLKKAHEDSFKINLRKPSRPKLLPSTKALCSTHRRLCRSAETVDSNKGVLLGIIALAVKYIKDNSARYDEEIDRWELEHNKITAKKASLREEFQRLKKENTAISKKLIKNPLEVLESIQTYPFYNLSECSAIHCALTRSVDPKPRLDFETNTVSKLSSILSSSTDSSASILCFACCSLFQELVIMTKALYQNPYAQIDLHIIDKEYISYTDYNNPDFKKIFNQFLTFLGNSFPKARIRLFVYKSEQEYIDSNNCPDIAIAADTQFCGDIFEYLHRTLEEKHNTTIEKVHLKHRRTPSANDNQVRFIVVNPGSDRIEVFKRYI